VTDYIPIQQMYRTDPWRVLVVCALLNLTSREQVMAMVEGLFARWPGPKEMGEAGKELEDYIAPCGLSTQRARRLRLLSDDFLRADVLTRSVVQSIHGCGQYAADSFSVFCRGDLTVTPSDRVLREYVERRRG
jgi:methyl-CpG-binding domain protein 4